MDRCVRFSVLGNVYCLDMLKLCYVSLQLLLSTGKKIWRGMQSWTKANAKSVWGNISHCAATSVCRQNVKNTCLKCTWASQNKIGRDRMKSQLFSGQLSVFVFVAWISCLIHLVSLQLLPPQSLSSSVHQPIVRFAVPRRSFWKNRTKHNTTFV